MLSRVSYDKAGQGKALGQGLILQASSYTLTFILILPILPIVIVDRRENKDADTGMFEMIYKQTQSTIPMPFNGLELVIQGKKLTKEVEFPK